MSRAERELFQVAAEALAVAGSPHWPAPDDAEQFDALTFVDQGDIPQAPLWALVPADPPGNAAVTLPAGQIDADDLVPVHVEMARTLIQEHLRRWLLDRGWQVQLNVCRDERTWRLADCLSIADGGGDRLDADYPRGDDELGVLCESVSVVQRAAVMVFPRRS